MGQVGHGGLQAGAVGGQLFGQQAEQGAGPCGVLGGGKGVQIADRPCLQLPAQRVEALGELGQLPGHRAVFQQGLAVLLQLPQIVFGPLGHAGALAEEHHRLLRQVVRRRGHPGIDQPQIPVQCRKHGVAGQALPVLLQRAQQGVAAAFAPLHPGNQAVQFPQQAVPAPRRALGQHLGGGQDLRLPDVLGPPLGIGVEEPQRIHLVPEKLRPHRALLGGRKEVQNPPAQGKLPHALHLLAAGVSRRRQRPGQFVQVMALPQAQGLRGMDQLAFGHGAL